MQGGETAESAAPEDGADGRERLASTEAISAAVMRSCRRATIAATRSGAVRCGMRPRAEEWSQRPPFSLATPGANTTWQAVRALLPAASAAGDGPAVQLDPLDEEPAATRVGAGVAVEPLR